MPRWAKSGLKTDVVFVDPPRKGLTPEFINAAVKTGPKKIVYISCNPATLVRDLQLFQEKVMNLIELILLICSHRLHMWRVLRSSNVQKNSS